jgi:hypothetical protein
MRHAGPPRCGCTVGSGRFYVERLIRADDGVVFALRRQEFLQGYLDTKVLFGSDRCEELGDYTQLVRRGTAVRFDRLAEGGRNEPLRIVVEMDDDATEREVFLKPSGRPELGIEGMANELLASCVAGHLGLPICEPVLVQLSPEWIASVPQHGIREMLDNSCSIAFGSTSAGEGWRRWTSDDKILGDRRPVALGIFVFDAFTENSDRSVGNPNLLVRGDTFRIIDHELCFRIRMQLFPRPEPWREGYLTRLVAPGNDAHAFGTLLRGDRLIDVPALEAPWTSLSDEALSAYGALMPPEWGTAAAAIDDALTHLRQVRDRIDQCLAEVQRALT